LQEFWWKLVTPVMLVAFAALMIWGVFSLAIAVTFAVLVLLLVMGLHARQLYLLGRWLADPVLSEIPSAGGIWSEIYSRLYKMVKRHNQTKQELATELQHIEQATAALPEGVAILGGGHRIEWCNPLAQDHFGLDPAFDIQQDITYLVRQPEFIAYLQASNFQDPLVMRPARHHDMVLSIKLVPYGEDKHLLISRDITQLERIEAMRRDFVANVSHELRTPLTVVNGFVENLRDMRDLDQADAQRALQLVAEQTARMENLVSDLLSLSRLENDQSPMREEDIDVPALLHKLAEEGRSLSAGRHILHEDVATTAKLRGNPDALRSAFANLLSNAIRYTPAGGEIWLRWNLLRDGQAVYAVRDSGIGIAPQHIPRLTERFYRVDRSRSRETGGTGLGLAIVKHIAMRHQAQLEIASEEGKGSTFSLVFPARRVISG
jgi:two-component system phosphate regulon sensor histidine kinase PhoR